jgi:hypothetical protein
MLNLVEIFEIDKKTFGDTNKFEKYDIELIPNSSEEIALAVSEFVDRIEGRWNDTPEDLDNQARYFELLNRFGGVEHTGESSPYPWKISTTYLKNNLYLLDLED